MPNGRFRAENFICSLNVGHSFSENQIHNRLCTALLLSFLSGMICSSYRLCQFILSFIHWIRMHFSVLQRQTEREKDTYRCRFAKNIYRWWWELLSITNFSALDCRLPTVWNLVIWFWDFFSSTFSGHERGARIADDGRKPRDATSLPWFHIFVSESKTERERATKATKKRTAISATVEAHEFNETLYRSHIIQTDHYQGHRRLFSKLWLW